ncbi:PREDICTED: G-type lectin S-receptor-like serine/threonine-protein kinase LECRK1 [Nelumbo nucifera]|uniref:Receptor-like serine/threonine-protein kinase n=2 Tax=Nelumbo nucifera TaxID=4432 RepID=A0A822YMB6_NELNU|nr:PREDICTED: G-type lectin S-receptor-like serine/threonine-protein kinase LECRK1 [Nelumbo nucifera]DAD33662.1 TPA_asm: hypothetical protein HUJ06_012513 [Nelumbo nucifera]
MAADPTPPVCFLLLLLLIVSYPHGSHAQTTSSNITLGSSITTVNESFWASPSGDFAFGFYSLSTGLFLVGIWFDKIPKKTLVWSANRNHLAPAGSVVALTLTGNLVLSYPNGTIYSIYNGTAARSASMENDGNFVLRNSTSQVIWQSFSFPTDTLLPGQVLVMGQKLYSNANGTFDYSAGKYMLEMQSDGNVVLSAYQFADPGYWDAQTIYMKNVTLIFSQEDAAIRLDNTTGLLKYLTTNAVPSPIQNYYHRATLDGDGNFRLYVLQKGSSDQWKPVWKLFVEPCRVNSVCGMYGFCTSPDNNTASCECLPGYSPLDPSFPSKGCYMEDVPESCGGHPSMVDVTVLEDADIPNSNDFTDYVRLFSATEESCKKAVMGDCYCMAATLVNSVCYMKRTPLLNARRNLPHTTGSKAFIKVPVRVTIPDVDQDGNNWSRASLHTGIITCATLVLLFALVAIYYHPLTQRRNRRKNPSAKAKQLDINLRAFSFQELHEATNEFTDELGRGAFGTVYSGILRIDNKLIEVAVKQLDTVDEQRSKEFVTELRIIGRTHHKNLVRLLGYCEENNHCLLVYELMRNGTLSSFLFKEDKRPNWDQRAEIALGVARGLHYLHEGCDTQIIHCDIKPQNVLLDKNYIPKIADFGLSKLLRKDQTRTSTNVRGTMGYMAPEWLKNAPITTKVDVYSFGVVLLETICCRRHMELNRIEEVIQEGEELILTDWVLSCMRSEKLEMIVKQDAEVLSDFKRFERMAMVSIWCIHPNPALRPSMKMVNQMLEGTIEVGIPPLLMNPETF